MFMPAMNITVHTLFLIRSSLYFENDLPYIFSKAVNTCPMWSSGPSLITHQYLELQLLSTNQLSLRDTLLGDSFSGKLGSIFLKVLEQWNDITIHIKGPTYSANGFETSVEKLHLKTHCNSTRKGNQ